MMMGPAAERGCSGDGCHSAGAGGLWPLHHVRHCGILRRLCTSCVLKSHPGSFCSACFDVLDGPFPTPLAIAPRDACRPAVAHCSKCPSVAHVACLPSPDLASDFICPSCRNPDKFSYFPIKVLLAANEEPKTKKEGALGEFDGELDGMGKREIDSASAKVLLAGAKLAAASMSRAAAAAKSEAERTVKEAALARRRARETLESSISVFQKERERMKDPKGAVHDVVEPKKKAPRPSGAVAMAIAVQKRAQNRERKKWMRFSERIPMVHGPAQGTAENGKVKGNFVAAVQKNLALEGKDRMGSLSQLHNNARQEEDRKGFLVTSQSANVKEEESGQTVAADKGPRILQTIQDASISKIR